MDRSQLYAILWLRWRLTRNQWSRGGQFNTAITMIVAILGVVIGVLGGMGGLLLGVLRLAPPSPLSIIVVVPWMGGLALGLVLSRGWAMLLLLPLMFGFLGTVTAWTYYL